MFSLPKHSKNVQWLQTKQEVKKTIRSNLNLTYSLKGDDLNALTRSQRLVIKYVPSYLLLKKLTSNLTIQARST